MGTEALARWIRRETNPSGAILRVLAGIATGVLAVSLGSAAVQSLSETPPPEAWGFIGVVLVVTLVVGYLAWRTKPVKGRVAWDALGTAMLQGNLAGALGENAEVLGQAAADLEQMEALLGSTALERKFAESVRAAGNARLRRMVDLTVAAPGLLGLTVEQARGQVAADGAWLGEARRLVEASRSLGVVPVEDETLGQLRELVQAREEAVVEVSRSLGA